ncbi:MAG: cysteine--tRNA ligase, partial [Patescibacteria group bacterium]
MMRLFGKKDSVERPPIVLYNTLGKKKEEFAPLSGRNVKMYTCGPTVYDYAQIGNLRSYIFADVLRRVIEYRGHEVKQVMNITDFGHLVADADEGEDKMTLALKREGLALTLENMKIVGERYAQAFFEDLKKLNIETPFAFPRASEHIAEQIAYIATLMDKGYAYRTSQGVYFDVKKFPKYGILGGSASPEHSRIGVSAEKHDSRDFTLWKSDASLGWDSPWGKGFPGWHIECTAMSTKYLGKSFDIHTGGIDHITIHHNNEIAQAEAATGKPLARYWLHGAFLTVEGKRIGKSEGNAIRLYQLEERGIPPLAYRYLILTGHYRQTMNFTWDAAGAAKAARERALRAYLDLSPARGGSVVAAYRARFGADPDTYAANAYDGMNLMLWAINVAGLNRAKVRDLIAYLPHPWPGVTGDIVLSAALDDVGDTYLATYDGTAWTYMSRRELRVP